MTETEAAPTCYRHPSRETYVRCTRCDRPICPDCMNTASVGFQCPDCVREGRKSVRPAKTAFGGTVGRDPRVTQALIVVNVAAFAYQQLAGARGVIADYGMNPVLVAGGEFYRLLTSAFLHGGVLHLLMNMYALFVLGAQVERALGRGRYLAVYFLSAFGAGALSYALAELTTFGVGASGAVYGLFGAYFVIARRLQVDTSQIVVMIGFNLLISFTIPFIDWRAHIGGLLVGGALTYAFAHVAWRTRRDLLHAGIAAATAVLLVVAVGVRTAQLV